MCRDGWVRGSEEGWRGGIIQTKMRKRMSTQSGKKWAFCEGANHLTHPGITSSLSGYRATVEIQ